MKPPGHTQINGGAGGFTLLETLVSMGILTLLILGVTQVLKHSAGAIHVNNGSMDSLRVGETMFSILAVDVSRMLVRPDVEYGFNKQTGDDLLAFYATNPGMGSTSGSGRPLSVVAYRMGTAGGAPQLQYAAAPVAWQTGSAPSLFEVAPLVNGKRTPKLSQPSTLAIPNRDAEFTTLAGEIIRFELCFLVNSADGSAPRLTITPPDTIKEVAALVVGVVIVDPRSRGIIGDPARLAAEFPDAAEGQDLLARWNPVLASPDRLQAAGVPASALSGVRVMQRYFTVSP